MWGWTWWGSDVIHHVLRRLGSLQPQAFNRLIIISMHDSIYRFVCMNIFTSSKKLPDFSWNHIRTGIQKRTSPHRNDRKKPITPKTHRNKEQK